MRRTPIIGESFYEFRPAGVGYAYEYVARTGETQRWQCFGSCSDWLFS